MSHFLLFVTLLFSMPVMSDVLSEVQKYDTSLYEISQRKYSTDEFSDLLKHLNPKIDQHKILRGTVVRYIPPKYLVLKGDQLGMISYLLYGSYHKYNSLIELNKDIKDPNLIYIKQVLTIPNIPKQIFLERRSGKITTWKEKLNLPIHSPVDGRFLLPIQHRSDNKINPGLALELNKDSWLEAFQNEESGISYGFKKAHQLKLRGETEEAKSLIKFLKKVYTESPILFTAIGFQFLRKNNYHRAISAFTKALNYNSKSALSHLGLIEAKRNAGEDTSNLIKDFKIQFPSLSQLPQIQHHDTQRGTASETEP